MKRSATVYFLFKRLFDIAFSIIALVFFLPLMCFIAFCIKLDSRGKIIYCHRRVGKGGKEFTLYKFRSMYSDGVEMTDEQRKEWEKDFKLEDDPRITRVGRILRQTSLDELPQLWNILKGDMSLIGPRPVVLEELERYGKKKEKFTSVLPGLTGYWQAYARNAVNYTKRMRMELYYIEHQSIWLDIKVFFYTIYRVLSRKNAM